MNSESSSAFAMAKTKENTRKFPEVLKTPTKRRKISSSPDQSPRKSPKKSPRKLLEDEELNENLVFRALENLNLAREGMIPTEFDLESHYREKKFEIECHNSTKEPSKKYDSGAVKVPKDTNGNLFITALLKVFSEAVNCGYFNSEELDAVFSLLSLSSGAQSLLARLSKRKRGWHKVESIKYPEIADDLIPFFRELVKSKFLDDDTKNEAVTTLLGLLSLEEIRTICKTAKVNHKGAKPALVEELVKLSNKKKSLFPGMKSPGSVLLEKIAAAVGYCVRVTDRSFNLLDRMLILLMPNQDPKEHTTDAFRILAEVKFGDRVYPPVSRERFPIFRNREHLLKYSEAREALRKLYSAVESKDWNTVCDLGRLAQDRLSPLFQKEESTQPKKSSLPSHIKHFEVNYVWAKVLSKSVEGFKKTPEGIEVAAQILRSLLKRNNEFLGNPTRWYTELALIEMHHRKNLEASAEITVEGLQRERLSDTDRAQLSERARKILARKTNISAATKEKLMEVSKPSTDVLLPIASPVENVIEARMVQGNTTGSKSTWSVGIGGTDVGYLRVEQVALLHYTGKGFNGGLHCEGALPITLFATLLWNEIYGIPVPGAFVSCYQEAPLDLYGSHFFENRREEIENKLHLMRDLQLEDLCEIMSEDFSQNRHYTSLMHGNLFEDPNDFKDFVQCLGKNGIIGICERLASNYSQWKSGFPDLAVWDRVNKKCKFVEVKGPGDSLSIKQKLWIQFLESLEVGVEVCIVQGTTRKYFT
ncbi:fanconi-associated nuclease 1-like [Venturia canescens]|uniref:fanconi-associated nuclease 1-like n=1 Tax=Venturia canescens TaxID=32260 RepID=UPI001C9C4101|nr:fanconi-associated nuclease 1-like [Venturia canescens]